MHTALISSLLIFALSPAAAPAPDVETWASSLVLVGTVDDEGHFLASSNGVVVRPGEVLALRSAVDSERAAWAVDASGVGHVVSARRDLGQGLTLLSVPQLSARPAPLRGSARLGDEVTLLGAALLEAPRQTHGRVIASLDDEEGATLRIDAALPPAGGAALVVNAKGQPVALAVGLSVLDGQPVLRARPLRTIKLRARSSSKRTQPESTDALSVDIPLLAPLPSDDLPRLQKLSDASLALALENPDDVEALEANLDAAVRWNPLSAAPWIRLARHLDGEGRWQEAQQAYEAAAVLPGDHRQAHCALAALTLHKRGSHDRAQALARRCLAASPEHSLSLAVLGAALAGGGQRQAAMPLLQQATSQDASLGWVHGVIGAIHHEAGELEAAVIAYRKGVRATPKSATLRLALGDAQLARNIPKRALRAFRAAAALDPDNAVIASRVGDALGALGHNRDARDAYQRALALDPKLEGVDARMRALPR